MRSYVKRVQQKAEKLSKEQILSLLEDVADENESLYSVLESLSTGLLIVDDDFHLLRYNQIAESWLPFTERLEDIAGSDKAIFEYINEWSRIFKNLLYSKVLNNLCRYFTLKKGNPVYHS